MKGLLENGSIGGGKRPKILRNLHSHLSYRCSAHFLRHLPWALEHRAHAAHDDKAETGLLSPAATLGLSSKARNQGHTWRTTCVRPIAICQRFPKLGFFYCSVSLRTPPAEDTNSRSQAHPCLSDRCIEPFRNKRDWEMQQQVGSLCESSSGWMIHWISHKKCCCIFFSMRTNGRKEDHFAIKQVLPLSTWLSDVHTQFYGTVAVGLRKTRQMSSTLHVKTLLLAPCSQNRDLGSVGDSLVFILKSWNTLITEDSFDQ